jgi:hypothetical protein
LLIDDRQALRQFENFIKCWCRHFVTPFKLLCERFRSDAARQRRFRDLPENAALILGYLRAWDNAKVEPRHQYPAAAPTEAKGSGWG